MHKMNQMPIISVKDGKKVLGDKGSFDIFEVPITYSPFSLSKCSNAQIHRVEAFAIATLPPKELPSNTKNFIQNGIRD